MDNTLQTGLMISAFIALTLATGVLLYNRRSLLSRVRGSDAERRFFEQILNSISDPIFVKDRHHRLVYVNDAECRLSGLTAKEMIGKIDYDLFPKEQADALLRKDDAVITTGEEDINEGSIAKTDGMLRTIVTKKTRYVDVDGQAYVVGIIRDITEHKQAEEEIRKLNTELEHRVADRTAELMKAIARQEAEIAERRRAEEALGESEQFVTSIVENIPDMIFVKDARQLRFVRFNKAAEQMIGYSRDEMLGKTDYDFFPKEEADFFVDKDRKVLEEKILVEIPEEAMHSRTLGERVLHTKKIPLLDNNGDSLYLLGIAEDITERKRAEEELKKYRDHLEEMIEERTIELVAAKDAADAANRAKSAFLASMSHELRTPLNAILGYAKILLREKSLSERQATSLSTINESGEHLLTLINDILDLSKVEAGKLELIPEAFNLPAFLENLASVIRIKAEQHSLLFTYDASPDLPRAVRADEKRLRQVLLNLLDNAVKFTDSGQVWLRVHVLDGTSASNASRHIRLRFEVRDTGIGMSQEQLNEIFRPFVQVGDVQRRLSGTGLGLAISRQLVRLMGGEIHVDTKLGQGSLFYFDLSLPAESKIAASSPQRNVSSYAGLRKRLLIVDDTPANRMLLVHLMGALGFDIAEATDGQQALEQARATRPDLILMDMVMPGMGGLEATRRLRQMEGLRQVPIIAVSA
ncbi:MAG: hypothetical protein V7606_1432, partial [Burkholderiales bacterium]